MSASSNVSAIATTSAKTAMKRKRVVDGEIDSVESKRKTSDVATLQNLLEDEINLQCDESLVNDLTAIQEQQMVDFYNSISLKDISSANKATTDFVQVTKDDIINEMMSLINSNNKDDDDDDGDTSENLLLKSEDDLIEFSKRSDFNIYSMLAYTFYSTYMKKMNEAEENDEGDFKLIKCCIRFIEEYKEDGIDKFNQFKTLMLSGARKVCSIKMPHFLKKQKKTKNDINTTGFIAVIQKHVNVFGSLHSDFCQKVSFASRDTLAIKSHVDKYGKFYKIDNFLPQSECIEFTFTRRILLRLDRSTTNKLNTPITNIAEEDKNIIQSFINANIQCTNGLNVSSLMKLCTYKEIFIFHTYDKFKVNQVIENYNDAYILVTGFQLSAPIHVGNHSPQNIIKFYPLKLSFQDKIDKISVFDFSVNED